MFIKEEDNIGLLNQVQEKINQMIVMIKIEF